MSGRLHDEGGRSALFLVLQISRNMHSLCLLMDGIGRGGAHCSSARTSASLDDDALSRCPHPQSPPQHTRSSSIPTLRPRQPRRTLQQIWQTTGKKKDKSGRTKWQKASVKPRGNTGIERETLRPVSRRRSGRRSFCFNVRRECTTRPTHSANSFGEIESAIDQAPP